MWQDKEVLSEEQRIAEGMLKKYLRVHGIVKNTKSKEEAIQKLVEWIKTWKED